METAITLPSNELRAAITLGSPLIALRPDSAWYGMFRLGFTGGGLTVGAFDGDTAAAILVPGAQDGPDAEVHCAGAVLAGIAKTMPAHRQARLAVTGRSLTITCGTAEWTIRTTQDEDAARPAPLAVPPALGEVPAAALRRAADAVTPAANGKGVDYTRWVQVRAGEDGLRMTATNRFAANSSEATGWSPVPGAAGQVMLVPPAVLGLAGKLGDGAVTVLGGQGLAGFACEGRTIITRLGAEEFPDVAAMAARMTPGTVIEVEADEFLDAVRRVGALTGPGAEALVCEFTPSGEGSDGDVTMSAGKEDMVTEAVRCRMFGPDGGAAGPLTIRFNPAFLAVAAGALRGGTARLGVTHPQKPVVVTPGTDPATYSSLIVPLRDTALGGRRAGS
jgi:DNA polymerase III subunit beta